MTHEQLARDHCKPRKGAQNALDRATIDDLLKQLPDWSRSVDGKTIHKDFRFADFYHTIGFVNALAFIANAEDHHPDLEIGYGHCHVHWSTHDVGGLSLNDFICAAKTDALIAR